MNRHITSIQPGNLLGVTGRKARSFLIMCAFIIGTCATATAFGKNPFSTAGTLAASPDGRALLTLTFTIPPGHYLYADLVSTKDSEGRNLQPTTKPEPYRKHDQFSNSIRETYTNSFSLAYVIDPQPKQPLTFTIGYQAAATRCVSFL